jgi:hypothetical protein
VIINQQGSQAVSNLGWVDHGSLWVYAVGDDAPRIVALSDAKYLTIKAGREDHFAVVHHYDANRLEITAHSHAEPGHALGRIVFQRPQDGPPQDDPKKSAGATVPTGIFEGERSVWQFLPRAYTSFAFGDYQLVLLNADGEISLQTFAWFDSSYDHDYQGIVDVAELPESGLLIVTVARDSHPILYDPATRQLVRRLSLGGRRGNPELYIRRFAREIWASDYDTLVKLDAGTLTTRKISRLQGSAPGTAEFIGKFCFTSDESMCVVARPYSGDVVALDPRSMRVLYRAALGMQPFDAAVLSGNRVIARHWKTAFASCRSVRASNGQQANVAVRRSHIAPARISPEL